MRHAYWGKGYGEGEINDFVRTCGLPYTTYSSDDQMLDAVVDELAKGHVIGWSQGRFEWGPRALGSRSILADPRRNDMKEIVNVKIKFREPFRPFAPSVLAEATERYFDLPNAPAQFPARFMLYVVQLKNGQGNVVPAVTHVDNTARPQAVHKSESPLYYRLIERFGQASGVPVLMNTSFNLKGEPIVNTPQNAFNTFCASGMDALVLGNTVVRKES
jgi:carbamoyltransferase